MLYLIGVLIDSFVRETSVLTLVTSLVSGCEAVRMNQHLSMKQEQNRKEMIRSRCSCCVSLLTLESTADEKSSRVVSEINFWLT